MPVAFHRERSGMDTFEIEVIMPVFEAVGLPNQRNKDIIVMTSVFVILAKLCFM